MSESRIVRLVSAVTLLGSGALVYAGGVAAMGWLRCGRGTTSRPACYRAQHAQLTS